MKKNIPAVVTTAVLMAFLFSSCMKDSCRRTYNIVTPIYTKLTDLRAMVKSKPAASIVNAGKLYIRNNWIFVNEVNKGIHVIDNSNPSHPVKTSFISIPGNIDMHIKGNTLYADLYCDLAAINITDPGNISVSKYLTNTFPDKSLSASANADSINIITGWSSRDTTIECGHNSCINCGIYYSANTFTNSLFAASTAKASDGAAGSMARFATVNNYMYAVTTRDLNVIDISDAINPIFVQKKNIGWDIETIFPYNNKLYIGAGSSMGVYDLKDPINPASISWNGHWCSHDPVVADDNYAYVTLHEANACNSKVNQLEVYDLKIPNTPVLIKTYPLAGPLGLSKDGNLLFVCDDGLKIYDASNPADLKLIKTLAGMKPYDVIASNGIAYVVTNEGLYQFDYSDSTNVHLLSKLLK